MEIQTTEYTNCHVINLVGRIDSETVPAIKVELDKLISEKFFHLILNMVEVSFVSSSGWWILINTQKACKRHVDGEVILAGLASRIQHSLQLVGMEDYFRTTTSVSEAIELFK